MKVSELLTVLVNSSEKAAEIARLCRSNQHLFNLLIEEKTGADKNERFFQDFKTLADVIIQETIKRDVGLLFPKLREGVRGEESNKFENVLGEKIIVEIESKQHTHEMLMKILDRNEEAASALTDVIHGNVAAEESKNIPNAAHTFEEIDEEHVKIWIDPIDGTQEYIAANEQPTDFSSIQRSGLQCATVLIGAYLKTTGEPFLGVINQPFAAKNDCSYKSEIFYGVSLNDIKLTNVTRQTPPPSSDEKKLAIISSSETFRAHSFKTVAAAGAGYKALKVIQQHADIYYLSKGSTFKWDTCACQAILRALGGDIVELSTSVKSKQAIPLRYSNEDETCNQHGLIAFIEMEDCLKLIEEVELS